MSDSYIITYTESIYYQIQLTARYLRIYGEQFFKKFNLSISFEEFVALDIINMNKEMCQRDLAKILLKDRSNTGKIAVNLKKKGLIKIVVDTKNNRLVKKLITTVKGKKLIEETVKKLKSTMEFVKKKITPEEELQISGALKKAREVLDTLLETQI